MTATNEDLLRSYLEELSYLRRMGARFADEHPKIARRLELQAGECPDPHVERLIESFAFLSARIRSDLDADFPEIAHELLGILYPHYLNPIPPMTVVRFEVERKLTEGAPVPRETPLFIHTADGDVCRFRTSYPVTLWPIEVTAAQFIEASDLRYGPNLVPPAAVLRVSLRSFSEPFEKLGVDALRFFLHGDATVAKLYDLLLDGSRRVTVVPPVVPGHRTNIDKAPLLELRQVGFSNDESLIHYPRQSHPAYRLLQEYFAFEEKFHFVDIAGLRGHATGHEVDLLFLLDREPRGSVLVNPEMFALGCTPAVNLFEMTSDPIRVDQHRTEYRLVPDHRRERSIELHSILHVSGSSDAANKSRRYAPFYSYTHTMAQQRQQAYWHARQVPNLRANSSGTDTYLSFHDAAFDRTLPADEVVFARILCTNGNIAAEIPAGKRMQCDEALAASRIINLRKPTPLVPPILGGEALWRLVSHLSLNYLSIEGEKAKDALREILLLYCANDSVTERARIDAIQKVKSEKIVKRLPGNDWSGFGRGTRVTVTLDETRLVGNSVYLLGSILNQFFALQASINSFTQLVVRRAGDERDATTERRKPTEWPLMSGGKAVL
jgi:type VI secretion system protein ImpG